MCVWGGSSTTTARAPRTAGARDDARARRGVRGVVVDLCATAHAPAVLDDERTQRDSQGDISGFTWGAGEGIQYGGEIRDRTGLWMHEEAFCVSQLDKNQERSWWVCVWLYEKSPRTTTYNALTTIGYTSLFTAFLPSVEETWRPTRLAFSLNDQSLPRSKVLAPLERSLENPGVVEGGRVVGMEGARQRAGGDLARPRASDGRGRRVQPIAAHKGRGWSAGCIGGEAQRARGALPRGHRRGLPQRGRSEAPGSGHRGGEVAGRQRRCARPALDGGVGPAVDGLPGPWERAQRRPRLARVGVRGSDARRRPCPRSRRRLVRS